MVKNPPAMQETRHQSLGREDPLEKGMATHSSILAWEIPWSEEPVRLQSMGLQESDMTYQLNHQHIVDLQYCVNFCCTAKWFSYTHIHIPFGFSDGAGQEWSCNAGDARDMVSVPGSGAPPGGGNGNPPQYSCWENPMDRGAWEATVHRVAKSWTRLSNWAQK